MSDINRRRKFVFFALVVTLIMYLGGAAAGLSWDISTWYTPLRCVASFLWAALLISYYMVEEMEEEHEEKKKEKK